MIRIQERETVKVPGISSLFVSFDFNSQVVDEIKLIPSSVFNPNTKEWEIPVTQLSELLDRVCILDDITLQILPEWYLNL